MPAGNVIEKLLLSKKTCNMCGVEKLGDAFTIGGKGRNRPHLQAMCKPCKATKEKLRRETDPEYRERLRVQSQQVHRERQAASLESASNSYKEWTGADLDIALRQGLSAIEAAKLVGRTVQAIRAQRHEHNKDPRKQALAGIVRTGL